MKTSVGGQLAKGAVGGAEYKQYLARYNAEVAKYYNAQKACLEVIPSGLIGRK